MHGRRGEESGGEYRSKRKGSGGEWRGKEDSGGMWRRVEGGRGEWRGLEDWEWRRVEESGRQ